MKITIPTPCHANWDKMTPDEKGRFCSVCSKSVHDFSKKSDNEVLEFFSNTNESVCGRFNANQLNKNLEFSFLNSLLTKFAVGLILTSGGWVSVNAQENSIPSDSIPPKVKDSEKTPEIYFGEPAITPKNDEKLYPIKSYESEEILLDEVKITGYRVTTKTIYTGTVKTVKTDDIISSQTDTVQNGIKVETNGNDKLIRIGGAHSIGDTKDPLVILGGKETTLKKMKKLNPDTIKSLKVLKSEEAIKKYGKKGEYGVIIVITK